MVENSTQMTPPLKEEQLLKQELDEQVRDQQMLPLKKEETQGFEEVSEE